MTPDEIDQGITALKRMCDPRGHDLLDAIGAALAHQAAGHELIETHLSLLEGQEIVDGIRSLPRVDPPVEHPTFDAWSRRAGLRSVQ